MITEVTGNYRGPVGFIYFGIIFFYYFCILFMKHFIFNVSVLLEKVRLIKFFSQLW